MSFPFSLLDGREAELAARHRLGVPNARDAALLANASAGGPAPASGAHLALAARAAARWLDRLAASVERVDAASAARAATPLTRR